MGIYQGRGNVRSATGNIIDPTKYFKQKIIYYGENDGKGIFDEAWSAFPISKQIVMK